MNKYFDLGHYLIDKNNSQIESYRLLKKNYLELYSNQNKKIKLKDICNIDIKANKYDLAIQRNSLVAGQIFMPSEEINKSNHIYNGKLKVEDVRSLMNDMNKQTPPKHYEK